MNATTPSLSLRQSVLQLLESAPGREEGLLRELESRRANGDPLYSSLLYLLTHLDLPEDDALRHWQRIRVHRRKLQVALGRDPGLRVAILDYFVNVNRELKNPKIIELAAYERTERSAVTDGLTGLYNHLYFVQALGREVLRAKRHGLRISLLLLDLDDFKQVNDRLGHLAGDRVLVKAATLIRESIREIDLPARYGGEEFAVLLPETARMGAYVVGERVRRHVEERFRRARSTPPVTISGGVATYPDDADTSADLIAKADTGLYRAKAAGKNRIILVRGERRRHRRVPARHPVTLGTAVGRAAARAKNVSEGGLLVSLRRPVGVGSSVSLVIRTPEAPAVGLRGEVVRVERLPGENAQVFEVGVRFLDDPAHTSELLLRRVKG